MSHCQAPSTLSKTRNSTAIALAVVGLLFSAGAFALVILSATGASMSDGAGGSDRFLIRTCSILWCLFCVIDIACFFIADRKWSKIAVVVLFVLYLVPPFLLMLLIRTS